MSDSWYEDPARQLYRVHTSLVCTLDSLPKQKMKSLRLFTEGVAYDLHRGSKHFMDFISMPALADFTDEERAFAINFIEKMKFSQRIHPPAIMNIEDYFRDVYLKWWKSRNSFMVG